ncbi:TadE/TadG family type IV pilus assembly protein [Cohaesibacter gelatinilyticus]|uniref:Flp pilus assembly protein TadG n=1 Tax=Cohaesibacter gelatinilyticus TaxID=372072 RepID=A0A285PB35_9HYPH|nr:TadE/TadG family type IV pilus assembly protein [Cohaesibacter gelatinilyticus]SNZ18945.1 Flp pilus assembly protein TadG [Cohaesibacter gelatinilyticus]
MHSQLARQLKAVLKSKISQMGHTVRSTSHRFYQEEQGAVAIIFALSLLPLIVLAGAAVDYSRTSSDRQQLQDAIDAAVLAAVNRIPLQNDDEIRTLVRSYVQANVPGGTNVNVNLIEIERNPNKIKVWANGSTKTTFMKLAQINSMDYKAKSQAVSSDKAIEVAMVLDNSGSMGGSRIRALKQAATSLVNILEENQQNSEDLRIALVPFNHLVRVDKGKKDASWLDQDSKSSLHTNNQSRNRHLRLPRNSNRLELFETLRNTEWEGCMEARKHPYDVNDTAPDSRFGDSYYLPFFFPDDRDGRSRSYISDRLSGSARSNPIKDRYGKYYRKTPSRYNPNYGCYIQKITPLTKNMNTVRADINRMNAGGWTNIHMGTIWGLRALSPQSPLTEGAPYSDKETIKFLIVMSDGANTYSGYSAYGYSNDGRISGSGSTTNEMNKRTLESCQTAKTAGVQVYTVAYGNLGSSTTKLLRDCATLPEYAFTPKNTAQMIADFKKIAAALNNVRITE